MNVEKKSFFLSFHALRIVAFHFSLILCLEWSTFLVFCAPFTPINWFFAHSTPLLKIKYQYVLFWKKNLKIPHFFLWTRSFNGRVVEALHLMGRLDQPLAELIKEKKISKQY